MLVVANGSAGVRKLGKDRWKRREWVRAAQLIEF